MNRHPALKGLLFVALIILTAAPTLAATIRVPLDQPTINDGLTAAVSGDTVLVA